MTPFRRILLLALACAPLMMAADQLTGFPFQNETLRYRVIWPGGGSLGDVTLTAHKAGDGGWDHARSATQESRLDAWLGGIDGGKVVVVECGAGTAIPMVRFFSV